MSSVLVTGANGFLGQHLCLYLQQQGFTVIATGRGEKRLPDNFTSAYHSIDLTDEAAVKNCINEIKPNYIVHTAAMSKPDECLANPAECIKQNIDATRFLTEAALANNSFFIYTSTDFIFGENGPHSEDEVPGPLNFYGECKLKAEEEIAHSGVQFAIVRPVFIYGPVWEGLRPSFLHWVKSSLEAGKTIKVVSDQLRTPTYVYDICKGIETIIRQNKNGVYHLAGKDILSPYAMAVATANVLGLDADLIQEVTSETFPEPVKRAKRSGLKINKAIAELNYSPVSFVEGIKLSFQ